MYNAIGGFFELELPAGPHSYHTQASEALSSGRACLMRLCEQAQPARIYLPFYICNSVLLALDKVGVPYTFYRISEQLEIAELPVVGDNEYLLYVNYFGLKDAYVRQLQAEYREKLLLDLTQAFFYTPSAGQWAFNSTRKFFGVPDGGYLYGSIPAEDAPLAQNVNISLDHLLLRQLGRQAEAYAAFATYEAGLEYSITQMSSVSQRWLSWINYDDVAARRRTNFALYHQLLGPLNQWEMLPHDSQVPFCYPLRLGAAIERRQLFEKNIFVPSLWQDVKERSNSADYAFECRLTDELLPLPVDHRYGTAEVKYIAERILYLAGIA